MRVGPIGVGEGRTPGAELTGSPAAARTMTGAYLNADDGFNMIGA
ncbi:hypothetical protein ACFY78_07670 [Streptomyces olindensis]